MKKNDFQQLVKEVIRECVAEGLAPNSTFPKTIKRSELKEIIKQLVRESIKGNKSTFD